MTNGFCMGENNKKINFCRVSFMLFLAASLFLTSCEGKKSDADVQTIEIDLGTKENIINLSDIADEITFVPLENTGESMLGSIDKLMIDDGRYVIVDKEAAAAVFVFDSKGRFLHKIGRKGKSKSEYIELTDAALGNGNVYIYDARGKKVIRYLMDGAYVESYTVDYDATAFRHVSGDLFAFYCGYTANLSLSDNGKIPNLIMYDFKSKELRRDFMYNEGCSYDAMPIEVNNLNPLLYGALSTDIYDIDEDGAQMIAKIDYGKSYNEELSAFVKGARAGVADMKEFQTKMQDGAFPMLINFMDCGNMYFAFCANKGKLFYNFHYLKSNKVVNAVSDGCVPVKDDMYDCITLLPKAAADGFMYSDVEPDAVAPEIVPDIDDNDNPVIVKIKLKD